MRLPAALVTIAIAVLALALGGCGGGGDSGSSSAATTAEATTSPGGATQEEPAAEGEVGAGKSESGKSAATNEKKAESGQPTNPAPLPNEGTSAVAPRVPTVKGGDNSVQAYGTESSADERIQGAAVVKRYLEAQVAGDWGAACETYSVKMARQFELLAKQTHGPPAEACEKGLSQLDAPASPAQLRSAADIEALSLRVQGEQAFLIYTDGEGTASGFSLNREGDEWKVAALTGFPLPL
ncbi:MAG: hypothetical protein H0X42_12410 [Solirubrobacterales bacterium]|nr:hypothetical protein [Solirubrobacterales bacterium]